MSAELISILALVVIFVLATTLSVNMGALAFAGAFLVGTLAGGLDSDGIFAGFPGDIFVVLVGVTYLFALARANGTTDWLVAAAVRLVGGRIALIPWVMFVVTGTLTAIGAVSPAACAIVAPIALGFAARYKISPLLMGAMVVHGAQAGGFSPISIYGSIVNGIVAHDNLPGSPVVLFAASLAMNTAIAALLYLVLGGTKLGRTSELLTARATNDQPSPAELAASNTSEGATATTSLPDNTPTPSATSPAGAEDSSSLPANKSATSAAPHPTTGPSGSLSLPANTSATSAAPHAGVGSASASADAAAGSATSHTITGSASLSSPTNAGAISAAPHAGVGSASGPADAAAAAATSHMTTGSASLSLPADAGAISAASHAGVGSASLPANAGAASATPHAGVGSAGSRPASAASAGTVATQVGSEDQPVDLESVRLDLPKAATLFGLVVLVFSTLVFDLDVGLTAITVAVVLSVLWPASSRKAVGEITWPTVLLICGVLTYVAVLQEIGTIDYVGNAVSDVGIPLLAALLLCYIGGIVSAFASSVGLMGALIPLAVPFLAEGTIGAVGMIAALAVSATMVDVSPFSTNGALVLANAKNVDRERFFRQLLVYGAIVVAAAPLVAWLVFVVPGWG